MEYNLEKITNTIKLKKKLKKLLKVIFIVLTIFLFLLMILINYDNNRYKLGNLYLFNIVSESMKPTINKNDIIVVKKVGIDELKKGDIITFNYEERVISHRISRIDMEGKSSIHTKGDNNEDEDTFIVNADQIYGKTILIVPKIGKYVEYLQKKRGIINVISIVVIIYIMYNYKVEKKFKRKLTRKKYEIKKIRDKYK